MARCTVKTTAQHPLLTAQLAQCAISDRPTHLEQLLNIISDTYFQQDRELSQFAARSEPYERFIECSQAINQRHNTVDETADLLKFICQQAAAIIGASRTGLWLFKDTLYQPFFEIEYDNIHARFTPMRFQSCGLDLAYIEELKNQHCGVLHDTSAAAILNPNSRLFLTEHKLASIIDLSINTGTGIFGLFRIAQVSPGRIWSLFEQQFAYLMADKISLAAYRHYSLTERENDESESRFKSLAQSSDAAIFAFRNFIFFSNSAMEKLTGFAEDALRVLPVSVLLGESFSSQFNSQTLKNTDQGTKRRLEIEFTNRSGETRWALISVTASNFENRPTWLATAIDITDRKRSEVQLNRQAFHDSLTGLPNRAKLMLEIDRCLLKANRDRNYKFALIFLDLDSFKQINDTLGHLFADEVLVEIAARLRALADIQHTAARLGGDEFAFLLADISNAEQANVMATKIMQAISRPIINNDQGVNVTASLGICLGDRVSDSAEVILRHADVAMYQAKELGRNRSVVFNREIHTQSQNIYNQEQQLRERLRVGDFQFIFAPILDTTTCVLAQFDCLLGWPTALQNNPVSFSLPSNDNTLLMAIEDWAIQKAVQHHAQFNHPCLQLNVTISGKSLADPQFIRRLGQQLAITPPGRIALNVLERDWIMLCEHHPKHISMMQELSTHWILDDFGSAQSSLIYLSLLPIKTLKIDARFIQSASTPGGQQPIKALAQMAKNMGIQLVVKGVQTPAQLAQVQRLGCPLAQGDIVKYAADYTCAQALLDKPLLH